MVNSSTSSINVGRDATGVIADQISGGTFNFISRSEEKNIHDLPLIKVSPYLGLSKFETKDKDKFFGRETWITELNNRLVKKDNILLLLGASGSGKSSLIRAGLIPRLEDNWGSFVNLTFRPDRNPFEALYYCLAPEYGHAEAKVAQKAEENTLIQVIQSLKQDSQWLIFIDQFEELFTTTQKPEREKFVASLVQLIDQKDSSIKIVLTMRADFLDRFNDYPALGDIHNRYSLMLTRMSDSELNLAIAEPAARNGVTFEEGLVDRIIKDFHEQDGSLPLLEYTLDLLWKKDNIEDRVLNEKTYDELGGVGGALNQQANKVYNQQLNEREREAAKEIFIELIALFEKQPVSRRANKSQFLDGGDQESALDKLIKSRLLVSGREKEIATVEVAHEQLLRSWEVLKDLIKDKEDIIILRDRLTSDANQWNEIRKKDEQQANGELWSGLKLEQVLKYRKDPKFNQILFAKSDSLENQFINASVAWRDRLVREKEERKQRELETAKKLAEESEARRKAEEQARQEAEQRAKESEARRQAEKNARKQADERAKAEENARKQADERAKQERKAGRAAQLTTRVIVTSVLIGLTGVVFYWQQQQQSQQALEAVFLSTDTKKISDALPTFLKTAQNYKEIANKNRKEDDISQALAYYRRIRTVTSSILIRKPKELQNENVKQTIENAWNESENALGELIAKYRYSELISEILAKNFGERKFTGKDAEYSALENRYEKGALLTTYKILMRDYGAGADLNNDGLINDEDEANMMPCRTLVDIENIWLDVIEKNCGWSFNGYDNNCKKLDGYTLTTLIISSPEVDAVKALDRIQVCKSKSYSSLQK